MFEPSSPSTPSSDSSPHGNFSSSSSGSTTPDQYDIYKDVEDSINHMHVWADDAQLQDDNFAQHVDGDVDVNYMAQALSMRNEALQLQQKQASLTAQNSMLKALALVTGPEPGAMLTAEEQLQQSVKDSLGDSTQMSDGDAPVARVFDVGVKREDIKQENRINQAPPQSRAPKRASSKPPRGRLPSPKQERPGSAEENPYPPLTQGDLSKPYQFSPGTDHASTDRRKHRAAVRAEQRNLANENPGERGVSAGETKRLQRNRISARRSRDRQKAELERLKSLPDQMEKLQSRNAMLEQYVNELEQNGKQQNGSTDQGWAFEDVMYDGNTMKNPLSDGLFNGSDYDSSPSSETSSTYGQRTNQPLDFREVADILDLVKEQAKSGEPVGPIYPARPASVCDSDVSHIFVEPASFSRVINYGREMKLDTYRACGGISGSCLLQGSDGKRRIRLNRGKIVIVGQNVDAECRYLYQKYVELDRNGNKGGAYVYLIQLDPNVARSPAVSKADSPMQHSVPMHGPVVVSQNNAGQGGMNDPLVQLQATSEDQDYMEFKMNGDVRGGIKTAENGGIVMSSESGDFAEWHPQIDKNEELPEGTVVGFMEGKVGLATKEARIFGVISERPVVVGNMHPEDQHRAGALVAYCGRVPVRVEGPVRAGDLLVPSGRGDGTAVVLATPTDADARLECEKIVCGPVQEEVHQSTIGVALVSNMASGPILVECSVTPPAMTKEVISSLRGKPQTEQATKLLCRIFCSISITLMLIFVVNSVAFAPGGSKMHHDTASVKFIPSKGGVSVHGSQYTVYTGENFTWPTAVAYCKSQGARMAQPKNQQDIARIDALFQVVPTESVSTRIWIGAKYVQADEDVRGQYQVSSLEEIEEMRKQQYGDRCSYQFVGMDGEGLGKKNCVGQVAPALPWEPGQPDSGKCLAIGKPKHHAQAAWTGRTVNDSPCDSRFAVACEALPPTAAPTHTELPSSSPTRSPTLRRSNTPTYLPTASPTARRTARTSRRTTPTSHPTSHPSARPTNVPTSTRAPTTASPTATPTPQCKDYSPEMVSITLRKEATSCANLHDIGYCTNTSTRLSAHALCCKTCSQCQRADQSDDMVKMVTKQNYNSCAQVLARGLCRTNRAAADSMCCQTCKSLERDVMDLVTTL